MTCDLAGCTLEEYIPSISVDLAIEFGPIGEDCCESLGPPPLDAGSSGQDVVISLVGNYTNNTFATQTLQGVFAANAPGDPRAAVQRGFLDDSAFTLGGSSTTARLLATGASLPFDLPLNPSSGVHLVTVSVSVSSQAFSTTNADFTPNGGSTDQPCWDDRRHLVTALGSAIGDGVYAARFDYDLDADVDNDDLQIYHSLFVAVACLADYNCSGGVSTQDLFDYQADYFSDATIADFNASGTVSVQDLFDFLAAYFSSGC